jgi:hypothetical protein
MRTFAILLAAIAINLVIQCIVELRISATDYTNLLTDSRNGFTKHELIDKARTRFINYLTLLALFVCVAAGSIYYASI